MNERDLLGPLREADRALSAASLSADARERIAARLSRGRSRPRLLVPALVLATGVAAAWIVSRPAPVAPAVRRAGFSWEGDACSATERAGGLSLDGVCRVSVEALGVSISSRHRVEMRRSERGVRLADGRFEFDVEHRSDRPVEVWVSAGVIEVIGTRFIVEQGRGRGHVDLLEGRIQFRDARGEVTRVEPGSRFVWIDAPAEPARPEPPSPPPPIEVEPAQPRVLSSADATEIIQRVQALRGERRYREAVELLRRARGRRWDRRTAEVLSFEEGNLIEHLEQDRACVHWRRHRARFRGGAYRDAVARALTRLDCR